MKRRGRLFAVFLVASAVAVWFVFIRDSGEPRIGGRPATLLLDEMNAGEARSNAAVSIIVQAGATAAPALTNQLRYESALRTNFIALKTRLPWVIASRLPRAPQINYLRRYSAIYALEKLGPAAKSAIPALLASITNGDTAELMMAGSNGGMLIGRSWSHELRAAAMNAAAKIDPNDHEVLKTAAQLVAAGETARGPAVAMLAVTRAAGLRALEGAHDPAERTVEISCEFSALSIARFIGQRSGRSTRTLSRTGAAPCAARSARQTHGSHCKARARVIAKPALLNWGIRAANRGASPKDFPRQVWPHSSRHWKTRKSAFA